MAGGTENQDAKKTVLIVDDNAQNLELLEVYMEDLPEVRVLTAPNGIEALERIEGSRGPAQRGQRGRWAWR